MLHQQVRTANGANEYTSIDPMDGSDLLWPEAIAHDAAGNLTVDPTAVGAGGVVSPSGQRYEYDEENRLTAVRRTGDDLLLAEYAYDALGRRVETVEHVDAATGLPLPSPRRTRHIHAGIETIEEYDVCVDAGGVETATLLREFVWGDGNRFPEPIALIDHTDAGEAPAGSAEVLHTLRDVLGSVVALVNATGAVVERYTYDPYGRTYMERWDATANGGLGGWAETDVSAFGNPFGWTGQRYDAGVGLYAFWFRTYSPAQGRWLQRDPLGYVDGVNLYEYVRGNPLFWVDPFGLIPDVEVKRIDITIGLGGVSDWGHTWIEYPGGSMSWWPKDEKSSWWDFYFGGMNGAFAKPDPHEGDQSDHTWPVISNGKTLKYGHGAGKKADEATDAEIIACLKAAAADWIKKNDGQWACLTGNCRDFAEDILGACGLTYGKDKGSTGSKSSGGGKKGGDDKKAGDDKNDGKEGKCNRKKKNTKTN